MCPGMSKKADLTASSPAPSPASSPVAMKMNDNASSDGSASSIEIRGNELTSLKKMRNTKKEQVTPRRPLSAYNLFFREERERIKSQIDRGGKESIPPDYQHHYREALARIRKAGAKGNKKSPAEFQAYASTIAERWKALDETRRQVYKARADDEMEQYKERKIGYHAKLIQECQQAAAQKSTSSNSHTVATAPYSANAHNTASRTVSVRNLETSMRSQTSLPVHNHSADAVSGLRYLPSLTSASLRNLDASLPASAFSSLVGATNESNTLPQDFNNGIIRSLLASSSPPAGGSNMEYLHHHTKRAFMTNHLFLQEQQRRQQEQQQQQQQEQDNMLLNLYLEQERTRQRQQLIESLLGEHRQQAYAQDRQHTQSLYGQEPQPQQSLFGQGSGGTSGQLGDFALFGHSANTNDTLSALGIIPPRSAGGGSGGIVGNSNVGLPASGTMGLSSPAAASAVAVPMSRRRHATTKARHTNEPRQEDHDSIVEALVRNLRDKRK